jgi:shikimate kinase
MQCLYHQSGIIVLIGMPTSGKTTLGKNGCEQTPDVHIEYG